MAWPKGRRPSPEHRAKIGAANRGKKRTPEHQAKIGAGNLGQKRTPEQRARMSAAQQLRRRGVSSARAIAALTKIGIPEPAARLAVDRLLAEHAGGYTPEQIAAATRIGELVGAAREAMGV